MVAAIMQMVMADPTEKQLVTIPGIGTALCYHEILLTTRKTADRHSADLLDGVAKKFQCHHRLKDGLASTLPTH